MNNDLEKLSKALIRIKPILEQGLTIAETAELLNISSSSIDKALQFVRKNASLLPLIDNSIEPNLFLEKLSENLKNNTINGVTNFERINTRKPTWDEAEALRVTYAFLANGYTLREAETALDYPKSTIYEILNSDYVKQIPGLYVDVQRLLQLNLMLKSVDSGTSNFELIKSNIDQISKIEKMQIQKYFLMQRYQEKLEKKEDISEKKY